MALALVDKGHDNLSDVFDSKDDSDFYCSSMSSCSDDDLVSDDNSNFEEKETVVEDTIDHNFKKRVHIW